jgi:hypothetical protein
VINSDSAGYKETQLFRVILTVLGALHALLLQKQAPREELFIMQLSFYSKKARGDTRTQQHMADGRHGGNLFLPGPYMYT